MSVEHIPNTGQDNNEFPFSHLPSKDSETGEEIIVGTGWESQVKRLGPDWVLKEVNLYNNTGKERSQGMLDYLRNPDRVKKMTFEQNKLEDIFGEDHFAKSQFVYGKDRNNKEGYMLMQKFIPGKVLGDLIGTEYANTQEMISKNREQFKDIVWGLKKSFVEFGMPLDFHPGNLMKNDTTGNITIMDAGIPSEEYEFIKNDVTNERTPNAIDNAYKRLERISRYENFLQLTLEEKENLDKKYNISDEDYNKRVQDIDTIRISKGIEIDIKESPVDQFLNSVFGDKQEVTGQSVFESALKLLGSNTPTESQKYILEKIKKQNTTLGDRSHWKQIIDL